MSYSITLSYNNDSKSVKFSCLPEKISISSGSKNKTLEVINLGEITQIKKRPLSQIKFDGFFPATGFQNVKVDKSPMDKVDLITKFKSGKKPSHLIMTGDGVQLNMYVTIESFDYSEGGGAVGDIDFSITLKEYRSIGIRKAVKNKKGKYVLKKVGMRVNNTDVTTYTVKKGDTLGKIAKKFLGVNNKKNRTTIYNLNKKTLDNAAKKHKNPKTKKKYKSSRKGTLLFKGTKIKIPEKYAL